MIPARSTLKALETGLSRSRSSAGRGRRGRGRVPRPRSGSPSRCRQASSSRARRGRRRTRRRAGGRRRGAARRSRPEAKLSPPPTRSRISRSGRGVASTKPDSRDQAIAPQSLTVAVRTLRSVVATTWKFGNSSAARVDHRAERRRRRARVRSASVPSTSKPRQAVKSSSLPIITSTCWASRRLTSRARSTAADRLPTGSAGS